MRTLYAILGALVFAAISAAAAVQWDDERALLPRVVLALLFVGGGVLLARIFRGIEARLSRRVKNPLKAQLTRQVLALTAVVVGVLLALDVLNLSSMLSAMLGAAGVFGLAVGFGLRDIVENYLAGVLLSLRSPFTIGDWISVSGAEGTVIRLTSRELVLMTIEGNHTRVPNASVFKSIIVNFSRNPLRRFSVSYSPAPGADAEAMRKAGLAVLREMRGVLDDPAPFVQTGGTWPGLLIIFIGWMDQRQDDFIAVQSEAARLVNLALERVGRGEEVGQALLESARNAATGRSGELDRQIALDLATGEASFLPPNAKDSQAKDIS
jgi:small-conductance mechanosensitive channel